MTITTLRAPYPSLSPVRVGKGYDSGEMVPPRTGEPTEGALAAANVMSCNALHGKRNSPLPELGEGLG